MEAGHLVDGRAVDLLDLLAAQDVAVAGGGVRGPDADHEQRPRVALDAGLAVAEGLAEPVVRMNDVVRRQAHDRLVTGALADDAGGQADARGGVADAGLDDEVLRRDAADQPPGHLLVFAVHHDQRPLGGHQALQPAEGLDDERLASHDAEELLGAGRAAERPESRTFPPCHDHGVHREWSPWCGQAAEATILPEVLPNTISAFAAAGNRFLSSRRARGRRRPSGPRLKTTPRGDTLTTRRVHQTGDRGVLWPSLSY